MSDRFSFIRPDLIQLAAYHPPVEGRQSTSVDRLDTNESPLDLPKMLKEDRKSVV